MQILWLWVVMALSWSKQTSHNIRKGDEQWRFDISWTMRNGQEKNVQFALKADDIKEDMDNPLYLKSRKILDYQAKKVNEWGRQLPNGSVHATHSHSQLVISAKGKNRRHSKKLLKRAEKVAKDAQRQYLRQNGYTTYQGRIVPDHIRHIKDAASKVQPLVKALGGSNQAPRVFAKKALSFTQSIPYEHGRLKPDTYRVPLSTLGKNKGDCDSKSVLFLALMHQAYPDIPLAIVYVPGHALVALGIPPKKGDVTVKVDGQVWVLAEPVGPALYNIGKIGKKSRRSIRRRKFQLKKVKLQ